MADRRFNKVFLVVCGDDREDTEAGVTHLTASTKRLSFCRLSRATISEYAHRVSPKRTCCTSRKPALERSSSMKPPTNSVREYPNHTSWATSLPPIEVISSSGTAKYL